MIKMKAKRDLDQVSICACKQKDPNHVCECDSDPAHICGCKNETVKEEKDMIQDIEKIELTTEVTSY